MTTRRNPNASSRAAPWAGRAAPTGQSATARRRSVPVEMLELENGAEPDQPFAEGAHDALDADLRHRMISETAYHLYTERGYAEGYDVDDWLQAEAAVDHLLLNPTT